MENQRVEIIKFGNVECEVFIYDNCKASLTYYTVKHPNRRLFKGKKFHSYIGGVDYTRYNNTYDMVSHYWTYDDSNVKYYI